MHIITILHLRVRVNILNFNVREARVQRDGNEDENQVIQYKSQNVKMSYYIRLLYR